MNNTRIRALGILVAAVLAQLCLGGIYAWSSIARWNYSAFTHSSARRRK